MTSADTPLQPCHGPAGEQDAPRRGRPRSEAAEQAIYGAVEKLMEDGTGLAELSIERIAAEAGVGKATIYRRWPNKEALLVDVVARLEEPLPPLLGPTYRDDLINAVDYMRRRGLLKRSRWIVKSALGQMNTWPELKHTYQERVVRPRRELVRQIVRRGVEAGELRSDLDVELLCELLIGPILLRTVLWDDSPLEDPDLPRQMVDAALQGIGARPAPSPAR
ncbi:TetR family transcriptional regulator [Kitasatospora sp. SolWspMP-SS2h]|uniref:TetR/AcrR family transcriptional regulator n=1 Tax=Kitasatospora sp. SolWspMP-SS2h TaxID=1305729 RepID=UPI000DB9B5FE|nr:TetR/AcrR family transcriptional regulator [Kitasatospora sp. SolWspMP-SS2h]RAJ42797.1 TetR family transcriptional regulator [Kitasatospora sp. SolWspMP-SS2h]